LQFNVFRRCGGTLRGFFDKQKAGHPVGWPGQHIDIFVDMLTDKYRNIL